MSAIPRNYNSPCCKGDSELNQNVRRDAGSFRTKRVSKFKLSMSAGKLWKMHIRKVGTVLWIRLAEIEWRSV